MIRELNQQLVFKDSDTLKEELGIGKINQIEEAYNNLLLNKEEINNKVNFKMNSLNNLEIDYMEDFIDLIDQYRDDVETFSEKKSVKAPAFMSLAATVGLRTRDKEPKSNKCCLPIGLVRAKQLSKKQNLSLKTIKRIKSFVSRHGANIKSNSEKNSKLWQSLMLWGVPYSSNFERAQKNIERVQKWADRQIKKLED